MNQKEQILAGLRAFARQRSGMDCRNYGDYKSYRAESRQVTHDLADAELLLRAVAWRDSITAEQLLAAARSAYSGRLNIEPQPDGRIRIEYCTGQYFPTEYRRAVCAVLASALWANVRDSIPNEGRDGKSPGELMRAYFRREFGRRLGSRYFD